MSNQRSETRIEGQSRKGAGSHLPLKRIPEHRTYSLLVHYWGARFQSPIKSNMVTRFILPLGRPWNLCPFEPAHTAVKGWRPLNLGEPVWLHPLPASWLSGYWLTRSLMHLGGILPHSLVALSGWNGPNYLPCKIVFRIQGDYFLKRKTSCSVYQTSGIQKRLSFLSFSLTLS